MISLRIMICFNTLLKLSSSGSMFGALIALGEGMEILGNGGGLAVVAMSGLLAGMWISAILALLFQFCLGCGGPTVDPILQIQQAQQTRIALYRAVFGLTLSSKGGLRCTCTRS